MAIRVECQCGKKFRAKEEHAGRRAKCPGCGAELCIGASAPAAHRSPADSIKSTVPAEVAVASLAQPAINLAAVYRPFVGKPVHYQFHVASGELRVHRDVGSAQEWTLPRNVASTAVKVGASFSVLIWFSEPGKKRLRMYVAKDPVQLHERNRLRSWLAGEPVDPPMISEQSKVQKAQESREAVNLLKTFGAFVLSIPLGVTIAAIVGTNFFPNVRPTWLAFGCIYFTYSVLKGMFGAR